MRNSRLIVVFLPLLVLSMAQAEKPLDIGKRLEPLVDRYLIGSLSGDAVQRTNRPRPREVILETGKPWEGNTCAYYTIFQDGDKYRAYYRGSHYDEKTKRAAHREVTCYAESKDGINWTKPKLGLFQFDGSKQNNIVWDGFATHCFTPFKDTNPNCAADAKYKALAAGRKRKGEPTGLYAFKSADGIKWSLMQSSHVITQGAFDSQNLAFWDSDRNQYREYHRHFRGVRDIMTGTSKDFLKWTPPRFLDYPGAPKQHLYTNAIGPYPGAPHLMIGFPTRFQPKNSQVEPTLMISRDRQTFHRWPDVLIPITAPKDRDGNRSNYMARGLVQLPGSPREHTVYATEAYYTGPDTRVRRFSFRKDGFVSVHARQGGLTTKPLRVGGNQLVINFLAPNGRLRVELQDDNGEAIPGFALENCKPLKGDELCKQCNGRGMFD